jgi:N6-adenosine-specific RNA methylase IME4
MRTGTRTALPKRCRPLHTQKGDGSLSTTAPTLAGLAGPFDLVYADPPWQYRAGTTTPNRKIENHYSTMTLRQICELPVAGICARHSVLVCWAPSPKLAEALRVVEAWGFDYRTCAVWVKHGIGPGYQWGQRHELLLLGIRGTPRTAPKAVTLDSVFCAPRGQHSVKPQAVYAQLGAMYPRARVPGTAGRSLRHA